MVHHVAGTATLRRWRTVASAFTRGILPERGNRGTQTMDCVSHPLWRVAPYPPRRTVVTGAVNDLGLLRAWCRWFATRDSSLLWFQCLCCHDILRCHFQTYPPTAHWTLTPAPPIGSMSTRAPHPPSPPSPPPALYRDGVACGMGAFDIGRRHREEGRPLPHTSLPRSLLPPLRTLSVGRTPPACPLLGRTCANGRAGLPDPHLPPTRSASLDDGCRPEETMPLCPPSGTDVSALPINVVIAATVPGRLGLNNARRRALRI